MTTARASTDLLLGDEAVALGAVHAGIAAAYSYPGTPATEILEHVRSLAGDFGVAAHWSANEKTAYEQALGVSWAGRRALVSMKHVGLNVAADPFVNSALLAIRGGLVVAVGDDPGMHSSQSEQDSRVLADFARILCLEPADPQQAYTMTREAFDLSERFGMPVLIRLVTRLCHGRAPVAPEPPVVPPRCAAGGDGWALLPARARHRWRDLLDRQAQLRAYTATCPSTSLTVGGRTGFGVVTTGVARNLYLEHPVDPVPHHLHLGAYPAPTGLVRNLTALADTILVLEEGAPFVERQLRGLLDNGVAVRGRMTGQLPPDGELTPELVRAALRLPPVPQPPAPDLTLPVRPPQLCQGCPHADSFAALRAVAGAEAAVMGDIGCYALGVGPPHEILATCVCMGASIGMAKGAADAGARPAVAVIGDSTFLHSGVTPLMDAVAAGTELTVLILDNQTVAMTGLQAPVLPGSRLADIARGVGVDPAHVQVVDVAPGRPDELAAVLREEIAHPGVSVVISVQECVEAAKQRRRSARAAP